MIYKKYYFEKLKILYYKNNKYKWNKIKQAEKKQQNNKILII